MVSVGRTRNVDTHTYTHNYSVALSSHLKLILRLAHVVTTSLEHSALASRDECACFLHVTQPSLLYLDSRLRFLPFDEA